MIYRLDPRIPFVWRTPSSVQLGIDPPIVVINDVTGPQERMLAALAVGVTPAGLQLVAKASAATRDDFLAIVGPALERPVPNPSPWAVTVCGRGAFIDLLAHALAEDAVSVTIVHEFADIPETRPDLAIIVAPHVIPPAFHGVWLRRDVPHLPIVFTETSGVIGPLVRPGAGACLVCLELHRKDADPSWPAIATQLLSRGRGADASALLLECAAVVCRIVAGLRSQSPLTGAEAEASVRIDAESGARQWTEWVAHPECGCRGIPLLATAPRQESDWAAVARDPA